MSQIFFLCPLVELTPNHWAPRIILIRNGATGYFPVRWTTTDAIRANKWAVGAADVTPEQLTAIQQDSLIRVIDVATERFVTFGSLSAQRRQAINNFLSNAGLAAAQTNEVLDDLLDRIIRSNEPVKNANSILAELALP